MTCDPAVSRVVSGRLTTRGDLMTYAVCPIVAEIDRRRDLARPLRAGLGVPPGTTLSVARSTGRAPATCVCWQTRRPPRRRPGRSSVRRPLAVDRHAAPVAVALHRDPGVALA